VREDPGAGPKRDQIAAQGDTGTYASGDLPLTRALHTRHHRDRDSGGGDREPREVVFPGQQGDPPLVTGVE
ncbi:MAG: hypothetical protein QGH45_13510, partial [Myxococcota bacterium]|nr:hypothetical protein [Myxococcota bacterium]